MKKSSFCSDLRKMLAAAGISVLLGACLSLSQASDISAAVPGAAAGSSVYSGSSVSAGSSASAASSSALPSSAAFPSVTGPLHVAGTRLCGKDGQPVLLRGISTHGIQWYPEYVNKDTFLEFRNQWNMNTVRLAMYTEEGGWCSSGTEAQNRFREVLHRGIRAAEEADMYVILDWHILSDGDPNRHLEESKAFFSEFSSAYRDADHILYEICNEPNNCSWSQIKSYAEQVIPVIRANDPDAVILVGTPNWSQYVDQAQADPVTGFDDLMYTLHFYADTHRQDLRDRLSRTLSAGLPVFVSECGLCDASGNGNLNPGESEAWLDLLDRNSIGCVFWNLSNKAETCAVISPSFSGTGGFTPDGLSPSGTWIRDHLTKN